jgi:hypothetical protein
MLTFSETYFNFLKQEIQDFEINAYVIQTKRLEMKNIRVSKLMTLKSNS